MFSHILEFGSQLTWVKLHHSTEFDLQAAFCKVLTRNPKGWSYMIGFFMVKIGKVSRREVVRWEGCNSRKTACWERWVPFVARRYYKFTYNSCSQYVFKGAMVLHREEFCDKLKIPWNSIGLGLSKRELKLLTSLSPLPWGSFIRILLQSLPE